MTRRYVEFEGLFIVTCLKCGSTDIDLWTEDCSECGNSITATCNKCGSNYSYHKFKKIEVTASTCWKNKVNHIKFAHG